MERAKAQLQLINDEIEETTTIMEQRAVEKRNFEMVVKKAELDYWDVIKLRIILEDYGMKFLDEYTEYCNWICATKSLIVVYAKNGTVYLQAKKKEFLKLKDYALMRMGENELWRD